MPIIQRMVVLSLAAILALTALPGCKQSQPESVTANDPAPGAEAVGGDEAGGPVDPASGAESGSMASSKFGRGVKLMAAGEPIDVEIGHLVPCVSDWNSDGKKDLIVGQFKSGAIRLYLNHGTDTEPVFESFTELHAGGKPIRLDAG